MCYEDVKLKKKKKIEINEAVLWHGYSIQCKCQLNKQNNGKPIHY